MEKQSTGAMLSVKEEAIGDGETLEKQRGARFVVSAAKRMSKAQAATVGPVEIHHRLTHAQAPPVVLSWYFHIHDTIKAVTHHAAFCLASLVHPILQRCS